MIDAGEATQTSAVGGFQVVADGVTTIRERGVNVHIFQDRVKGLQHDESSCCSCLCDSHARLKRAGFPGFGGSSPIAEKGRSAGTA